MLVDYHTHTVLCKHATGRVEDYVLRAIELGLDEIGCSEHIPMPDGFDERHRMSVEEFDTVYLPEVSAAREKYDGQIRVKIGVEADFFPGTESWIEEFVSRYEFDYVLGSVHFLGEWGFDDIVFVHRYNEENINDVYTRYFDTVRRSAETGLFDIIAHFDLVKKFGHRPTVDISHAIRRALEAVKEHGLCMEVNTSGLRKPVREIYPGREILEMIRDLEIPLTLGSDAHEPTHVGASFDEAVELIKEFGGGKLSVFDRRERFEVPVTSLRTMTKAGTKEVAS